MDISGLLGGIGSTVAVTAKVAAPALLNGFFIKHGAGILKAAKLEKLSRIPAAIPNGLIPYVNLGLGTIVGTMALGNVAAGAQYGVEVMTGGIAIHQLAKVGAAAVIGKIADKRGPDSWAAKVEKSVGPGGRLSI